MKDIILDPMTMQPQHSSEFEVQRRSSAAPADSAVEHAREPDHAQQAAENRYRAVAYSILAALLRKPPGQDVLNAITGMADAVEQRDEFAIAMSMLGLSARAATPVEVDDEFHTLFIGIGRGELVPYGSWYLTGFLMEKPLGVLREDLAVMGFARDEQTREPEDHAAALCEVMVLLINEGRSLDEQTRFFERHMAAWLGRFFTDLGVAKSAVFYRSVARFGKAFIDFEKQYLAMEV